MEGRRLWKGMSANSIIILRGLNMADCHACDKGAFCCWATLELGRKEMNGSVSVFGSFEPKLCMCVYCRCTHVSICVCGCMFFFSPSAHMLLLCSSARISSPQNFTNLTSKYLSVCLELTVSLWVSGTLRPPGRRPMRKGRSGWGPIQQGGFRTQAASHHCLLLELPAPPLENTTTPTCVSL